MYCVIETVNTKGELEVSIASNKWISGCTIAFPSSTQFHKYLHKHQEPANDWPHYNFRMLANNIGKKKL